MSPVLLSRLVVIHTDISKDDAHNNRNKDTGKCLCTAGSSYSIKSAHIVKKKAWLIKLIISK